MSIKIYTFEQQTPGGFNNGEILENRPVVLTEDPAQLQPYSNLFYWAHAWSEKGSTIGEHPHKAFEILSFIVKGSIEHYDSKNRKWIPLQEGDVQIIRSGSGISHSEKINAGSEMFQIWFDPDLSKTINTPATYDDFKSGLFPVTGVNGLTIKTYTEDGSELKMVSPGVSIKEISFGEGEHELPASESSYVSAYLIEGSISVDGNEVLKNYFFVSDTGAPLKFTAKEKGKLFIITNPLKLNYRTYAERYV
jgi:redox-sensitive bicupin YhaK (pirin superfamily)